MARRSPTLEGFRILFRMPSLGLAEIAWRWAIGAAFLASLTFAVVQYLDSLPVTQADLFLLRTRQPIMVSRALARIFAGSGLRFFTALIVIGITINVGWIIVAAVGRAFTLKSVLAYFFPGRAVPLVVGPIMNLNALRAAAALAAGVSTLGALLLAAKASPATDPSPGTAMLIFLALWLLVSMCWIMLNWLLSLAAIFVMTEQATASEAISRAVDLLRHRTGGVAAITIWFGLAHGVAYVVASTAVGIPLAFTGLLPGWVVFGGVVVTSLLYFALVDYLYIGRLAAYLFLAENPEPEVEIRSAIPPAGFDTSELILSDVPLGHAPA
jgi:hypothetical protein